MDFLTPLTLDSIHNRVREILDPENLGVAVEIAFLCAIEAELHLFYAAFAWSAIYYRFCSRHIGYLGGVKVTKLAIGRK